MGKSFIAAMKKLEKDVQSVMKKEMKQIARSEHRIAIINDVYEAYNPIVYERRDDLWDDKNIDINVEGYELTLKNITPPNPRFGGSMDKNLSEVIETGHGYDYDFAMARPFLQSTEKGLETTAEETMEYGLNKRGWMT